MDHKRHSYSIFILALAVLISWGCATTSMSTSSKEQSSNVTAQTAGKSDYFSQRIDANISSAIRMKFATDELLSDSDINVDTSQRNVTLRGKINTEAEANRAIHLGRSVTGVRSVHSNLSVKKTKIMFR